VDIAGSNIESPASF